MQSTLARLGLLSRHLKSVIMFKPNITVYTADTPNGQKVTLALEELGIPYNLKKLSFAKNEQKEDWFLKINPNGRIPAIVDHSRNDFPVFESGAILLYLVQHYDPNYRLWPTDIDQQSEVVQWVMFQMGGVGPMQGQANHFSRFAPEKIPYGINRYQSETKRLYQVLDGRLQGREYLVGDHLTIADIINFPWVLSHNFSGVSLDDLPNLQAWVERIRSRATIEKAFGSEALERLRVVDAEAKTGSA
ncbi:glutathione S-transferase [Basidiobolus meristosporus CBS 931.73]|uniref:Glutathione S-transferase n=1 Tax=Basidiobolus meristosporus CBS 931.73 TaxID=1314790 RepID=A0A1Y1XZQ7_9FUNG|nr:glutathione S-transferase [Basidiobolus meristosporus CBS 931.73]|eukprot:ORX91237.1 glutathione S-transferase [Basidiobolus meristosporus CBS 931.73]